MIFKSSILSILLIGLFIFNDLKSQGFIKKFTYPDYVFPKLTSIQKINQDYWVFGSVTDSIGDEDYLMINKIDSNGVRIFYSIFKNDTIRHWFNNGIVHYNEKLFTVTNNPYLSASLVSYDLKTDLFKNIVTIKGKDNNNSFFTCNDFTQDNNGDFIIASAVQLNDITSRYYVQINKITSEGIIKWTYTKLIEGYNIYPTAITIQSNNEIIIACHRFIDLYDANNSNSMRPLFLHLSNNGNLNSMTLVNKVMNPINDFLLDEGGNYICAAADTVHTNRSDYFNSVPVVTSISSNGNINWLMDITDRKISYNSFEQMMIIKFDSEKDLYYSSGMGRFINKEGGSYSERNMVVVSFNNHGDINWNRRIKNGSGTTNDYCYDLHVHKNEIILVGGSRSYNQQTKISEDVGVFIKLNQNGCLLNDCLDYKIDSNNFILYVAPNPAQEYLNLFSKETKPIDISLFNSYGILLYNSKATFLEGTTQIPIKGFIPGVYFLSATLQGTNKKINTKILIY
jgi:hypothetical protein